MENNMETIIIGYIGTTWHQLSIKYLNVATLCSCVVVAPSVRPKSTRQWRSGSVGTEKESSRMNNCVWADQSNIPRDLRPLVTLVLLAVSGRYHISPPAVAQHNALNPNPEDPEA